MPQPISRDELARNDGRNGARVYIAYQGMVYDATDAWSWTGGSHFGEHDAGQDLTAAMEYAPHGPDEILSLPVLGPLVE